MWARVVESVRPLGKPESPPPPGIPEVAAPPTVGQGSGHRRSAPVPPSSTSSGPGTTLDASWDRRLSRGLVAPDVTLDLHGHNLAAAYDLLDRRLEQAIRAGARLLLLVTGKPPAPERRGSRGAIRAAVGDWLAASRHAGRIAAVRNAHPRHGGAGALYIVLRRSRP